MDTLETNGKVPALNRGQETRAGLFIAYAADAPELVGSFLPLGRRGETMIFGRGGKEKDDKLPRALPIRQRPEKNESAGPSSDPFLSRDQLRLTYADAPKGSAAAYSIHITNIGKRDLLDASGRVCSELILEPGDVAEIRGRILLLAGERPDELPAARSLGSGKKFHPFGDADADGFVGESPNAWKLRDVMAFVGGRSAHVLLLGESGTGKEIVANAIHRLSARSKGKKLVARNAATLPAGLIDAELFGHVANYPNVGMPERPGLIAESDGSTLFLDEIGELSHELSTRLLRVLDEKGEYQRLGDSRMRTSSFRLLGATNRPLSSLKEDVAARFRLRISVPTLRERREDIPLLARHLLRRAATQDEAIGERFFLQWAEKKGAAEPRIAIDLMRKLLTHDYRTNIRELDVLLWASLGSSGGDTAELTPEVEDAILAANDRDDDDETTEGAGSGSGAGSAAPSIDVRTLTIDDVKNALERAGGVHEKAWRDLGLANRHVLKRLVKKFGLGSSSTD